MALPRSPFPPRPGTPLPRRTPAPRPRALPLLPLIAATLMLLAAGQIALWAWKNMAAPAAPAAAGTARAPSGNPFRDLALSHPKLGAEHLRMLTPRRAIFPARPENLQFGVANADITLTVLSDPACGACRETLKGWLEGVPKDIRVVYKFWPATPERMTPGLALEMARRKGLADKLWTQLDAAKGDLDDLHLLSLLEQAGLPLEAQRNQLAEQADTLAAPLEEDIRTAQALQLPPPPVLIMNGTLLDGRVLQPERLLTYMERLRANMPLVQGSDYWLMEK